LLCIVEEELPLKQGLKRKILHHVVIVIVVEEELPLKQGLKLYLLAISWQFLYS